MPYDPNAARMAPSGTRTRDMDDPMTSGMQSVLGPDYGMEAYGLESMSEEDLQRLVELGVIDEQMAENARQMALQEELRYRGMPEGRDSGRVYTAANPLEFAGELLSQYNAQKKIKGLEKERGVLQDKQTAGRQSYWDILRGMRRKPQDLSWLNTDDLNVEGL